LRGLHREDHTGDNQLDDKIAENEIPVVILKSYILGVDVDDGRRFGMDPGSLTLTAKRYVSDSKNVAALKKAAHSG
jgi:hypothetical protein